LFEIVAENTDQGTVLKGVTNLPLALDSFREQMRAEGIVHIDSIELLPSESLKGKVYGLIDISVANIRARPSHSAELVTQSTLGMPVRVYQKKGSWYRIQTPDQYLGWVDSGGLELMDKDRFEQWQATEKLIYTQTYGHSHIDPDSASQAVSDLVAGNILQLISQTGSHYQVGYPDGRKAFVPKSGAKPYADWKADLPMSKE